MCKPEMPEKLHGASKRQENHQELMGTTDPGEFHVQRDPVVC